MYQHPNVFKCNICTAPNCPLSHKQMQQATDTSQCKVYRHPVPFRMPILVQLASDSKKINTLKDVLEAFGFQIREKLTYPYFTLVVKNV